MLVRAVDGVVLAKVDAPGNLTEQGIQLIVRVEEPGVEDAVAQGVGKFLPVDARGRLDAASKSEVHMLDGEVAIDSYAIVVAIDIDCHNYRFCKRGWVSLAAIAFASIST